MKKWQLLTIIFISACAVILSLFLKQYNTLSASDTRPLHETFAFKHSNPVKIAIMGDSIAKGTGDEMGQGFSSYIPEYLMNKTSRDIYLFNGGIDELKSSELLEKLKSGDLDSNIRSSDILILSIGGNDILTLHYVNDSEKLTALKNIQETFVSNLKEVLGLIRNINSEALIIFPGLYNPREDENSFLYNMLLNSWNSAARKVIEADFRGVFIDTQEIFKSDLNTYISSDKLHPSSVGYRAVSEKIAQLVRLE